MNDICVSKFGLKVLQKMEPGNHAMMLQDGSLKVGALKAPSSLVVDLARRDLIMFPGEGVVTLTEAGAMYMRRMKTVKKYARSGKAKGGDNIYRAQHS